MMNRCLLHKKFKYRKFINFGISQDAFRNRSVDFVEAFDSVLALCVHVLPVLFVECFSLHGAVPNSLCTADSRCLSPPVKTVSGWLFLNGFPRGCPGLPFPFLPCSITSVFLFSAEGMKWAKRGSSCTFV